MLSLLPPVVAIVLALNTKEVYTSLLVGIATGALLFANGNLELAVTTLFFNEDGGMVAKPPPTSTPGPGRSLPPLFWACSFLWTTTSTA